MPSLTTTLDRDDGQLTVEVEYDYHKACRGRRDRYGAQEEPDEDAYVELVSVQDEAGVELDLSSKEEERLEQECLEDAENAREDARIERAERD